MRFLQVVSTGHRRKGVDKPPKGELRFRQMTAQPNAKLQPQTALETAHTTCTLLQIYAFLSARQPAGHDFFLRKNGFGSSAPVPSFRSAARLDGMRTRSRKKGGSQKKISGTCFEKGAGLFCRRATRKQKRCPSLLSGRTPKPKRPYVCQNLPSMISLSTSVMSSPAARTCWGMKLVSVIPGVVLISSRLICSLPFSPVRM